MEHVSFVMKCDLKKDTPEQVIETLKYLVNPQEETFENHPDHPLFEIGYWEYILRSGGGDLWDPDSRLEYDAAKNIYTLIVRTSIKHPFENPVETFLHWIVPYSATEGFVGHAHPEYSPYPSRILFENGRAYLLEPVDNADNLRDFIEPEEDDRHENVFVFLQQLAQDNPEVRDMVKSNFARMQGMDPNLAPGINDPQFIKLKEKFPDLFGGSDEKDS